MDARYTRRLPCKVDRCHLGFRSAKLRLTHVGSSEGVGDERSESDEEELNSDGCRGDASATALRGESMCRLTLVQVGDGDV